ncbi:MAG: MFS transporter [Steroidobacteraceae bacterium]|nr:MFS transporter [Steroidobacteraceae bacterium]
MLPVPDRTAGSGYAWYATFVLMLAYTLSYIDRQILSLLVEPIKADFGVTDTQIGLLQGAAFAIFYTLAGIPMGRLADRGDRRKIIAYGVAFWSLATALCGITKNYWQLFLARVGVGIGEAALGPAAYSMLADYFEPAKRGRALGFYSMGVYLGIGLAMIIGAQVVTALADDPPLVVPGIGELGAWHLTFLIVGLPGVLLALWVWTLREPPRRGAGAAAPEVPLREALAFLRANRATFGAHFLGFSMVTLLFNAVVFWMAPYLMRVHGLAPAEFGITLGLILAIGGAIGIYAGGAFADALRRRGVQDAELWSGILGALLLWPFGLYATQAPSGEAALIAFVGFMVFASFPFAAAAAGLTNVTPNRLRGQVAAVYLFAVNLAGIGLGSFLTGFVNDHVFADPNRIGDSMAWIVGIAAPLAAAILWFGRAPYRRSLAALG